MLWGRKVAHFPLILTFLLPFMAKIMPYLVFRFLNETLRSHGAE